MAGQHRQIFDLGLAVALTVVTIVVGLTPPYGWQTSFDGLALVLTALVNMPLVWRRRSSVAVFVLSSVAFVTYLYLGYFPSLNQFGPLIGLYTVAAYYSVRIAASCAVICVSLIVYCGVASEVLTLPVSIAQALIAAGMAWMFGNNARLLASMASQLKQEQSQRAKQAVSQERVRIARELHDVVAHHMSVISVQAGLAQYVQQSDPDTVTRSLDTIAVTSRQALDEMRQLLSVLRLNPDTDDALFEPVPGLNQLGQLAARVRAAGVQVDVAITGQQTPLSPGHDLCLYRIIQEALTNVIKHAAPAKATVSMHYSQDRVTVRIIDDGERGPRAASGDGHGIAGMRERARIYGGTLRAGACHQGGFEVFLTLPVRKDGQE